MKKKILVVALFTLGILLGSSLSVKAQVAYGLSWVNADNPNTRIVEGYSATWLDYYAGYYYDPAVDGELFGADNEVPLDEGYSIGYSSTIPAEVLLFSNAYTGGQRYCTYSSHFVYAYFYYVQYNQWLDPYRYNFGNPNYPPWGGSPFGYYYMVPRRYYLGSTGFCEIATSLPTPTPTVTPTITPTPSPTPCDINSDGTCQGENMTVQVTPNVLIPVGVPGSSRADVTIRVTDYNGNPVANRNLNLELESGAKGIYGDGHIDSEHSGSRPLGKLEKTSGATNSNGEFKTFYNPPHISGLIDINVNSLRALGVAPVGVGIGGLVELTAGENYVLIGWDDPHPSNHWGTSAAVAGLVNIANDYKTRFYGSNPIPEQNKLHYNDMSLRLGGKFDLKKKGMLKPNWNNENRKHDEHRTGINTDVRCCSDPGNVPRERWVALNEMFRLRGSTQVVDETTTSAPHWHLKFLFNASQGVIERTSHIFVEDVFGAALERESTQTEYETWLVRLRNAKAQGQSQLLLEAIALERELFESVEYVTRFRTDEEFIEDVFLSHLFREPTETEAKDWLTHLQSITAITQQAQRSTFLYDFENEPEFQSVVFGIVEPTP